MGSIAESDRCSIARTRNRTVAILFNQKTACRTMFGRATSRATVEIGVAPMNLCPLALKQADTVPMIFPAFVLSRRPIPLYEASSDDKLEFS